MKIVTIILILIIASILYYLYLNIEKFTQTEELNNTEELDNTVETYNSPSGTVSDITGMYTPSAPSNTPSGPMSEVKTRFRLNLDYGYYVKNTNTKNNTIKDLSNELSSVLSVSKDRFKITDIKQGSLIVNLTFNEFNTNNPLTLPNDNMMPIDLHNLLVSSINDMNSSVFQQTLLKNIDTSYILLNLSNQDENNLSPIIPQSQDIITKIISNNYIFALSVTVPTVGIYPSNMENPPAETNVKLYLTVANNTDNYNNCTSQSGMLSLEDKLTKGGLFNLSAVHRLIPKNKYPFKYLDFNNVIFNSDINEKFAESIFYGLTLYKSPNYISYCMEGCENKDGYCAQEKTDNSQHLGSDNDGNNKTDPYKLKNLLKFVIEGDSNTSTTVTPYFISMDPEERIHFLTNNYNTIYDQDAYKKIVQVPIYEQYERPYYKQPEYINTNSPSIKHHHVFTPSHHPHTPSHHPHHTPRGTHIKHAPSLSPSLSPSNSLSSINLVYAKNVIKNLEPILSKIDSNQLNDYAKQDKRTVYETYVTKNQAYIDYALKFNIEILTVDEANALT